MTLSVGTQVYRLVLSKTFVIARGARTHADVVYVTVRAAGVTGYGEAAPNARYGESVESATAFIESNAGLIGDDPWAHAEILARLDGGPGNMAARAALDAALYDLRAKSAAEPVRRLLGLSPSASPTTWTVSLDDPDEMARAASRAARRFAALKLKLGGRDGLDVDRVRAVRSVTEHPLRIDVNEGWTFEEAAETLPRLGQFGIELCEQPLAAGDPDAQRLRALAPMPIFVDEDCHTLADVVACSKIAHGINIKLAKSGGITEAVRMIHAARALGLGVMIGCMVESSLGIAAAAAIASLCDYVDLDGHLQIKNDPWTGLELEDGALVAPDIPGLGVRPATMAKSGILDV
jgi:L-alanine-DL-glutamate epimerase-like enolase superfamily enzyme